MHATHTEKTKFFDNDIEKTGAKIKMPAEMGYVVLNGACLVLLSRARLPACARTHAPTHPRTHARTRRVRDREGGKAQEMGRAWGCKD